MVSEDWGKSAENNPAELGTGADALGEDEQRISYESNNCAY